MRVTLKTLKEEVKTLNAVAGVDPGEEYLIDCAYGAYKLAQLCGGGSTGERDIFSRDSAKIVYNQIAGMIAGIDSHKKRQRETAVDRFLQVSDNDRAAHDHLLNIVEESRATIGEETAVDRFLDDLLDDIQVKPDPSLPRELQEFRGLLVAQFVSDMRHDLNAWDISQHYRDKLREEAGKPPVCRVTGCDGQNVSDDEYLAELRALPLPGGGNAILCRSCAMFELHYRTVRNQRLPKSDRMDLPAWDDLQINRPAPQ